MNSLSKYITEKLQLKKGIKRYNVPAVTDSDEVFIHNCMRKSTAQCDGIARRLKNKDAAIQRYVAALKLSGSSKPTIVNDRIYSQPSNNFKSFGDRALELGWTIEEIQYLYDASSNINPMKSSKDINNSYFSFLIDLLPNIHRKSNGIPEFDNNEPTYNYDWSDGLKKYVKEQRINDRNDLLPQSYIIKINGKAHIIEHVTSAGGLMHWAFWIDGNLFKTYNEFAREILNL